MRKYLKVFLLTGTGFFLIFSGSLWAASKAALPTTKVQVQADPVIVNFVKVEASPIVVSRMSQIALLESPPGIIDQPPNAETILQDKPFEEQETDEPSQPLPSTTQMEDLPTQRNAVIDQEFERLKDEMDKTAQPKATKPPAAKTVKPPTSAKELPTQKPLPSLEDKPTPTETPTPPTETPADLKKSEPREALVGEELDRMTEEFQKPPSQPQKKKTTGRFKESPSSDYDKDILNRAQYEIGGGMPPHHPSLEAKKAQRSYFHHKGNDFETNLQLGFGYRVDDLDWSIAGDSSGQNPNVLSELTWRDLESYELKAKGNGIFKDKYVLDGSIAYAEIFRGENQDSDYTGNNRTGEFSRSNNRSDEGDLYDLSAGLGYRMHLNNYQEFWVVDDLWLSLLGGYSYHSQDLRITDGVQTIPATGPFAGFNSKYETEWQGPWLGVEFYGTKGRGSGFLRFEYHFAVDYYAEADWNLRTDFQHPKSFEHEADGTGMVYGLGGSWALNDNWSLGANIDIYDFETDEGVDRTFFSNGTTSETQLNEVSWSNWAALLVLTYRFGR